MYEISRLIIHVIGKDKKKEKKLVEKLGYKDDLSRGYSKLRRLMHNGKCNWQLRMRLPKTLGIDSKFIEEAFKKTEHKLSKQLSIIQKQREELEKKRFRPYIWIEHEYDKLLSKSNIEPDRYESLKTIELPSNIDSLAWDDQIKLVRKAINLDQKKAKTRLFGNAISYLYFKNINKSYLFDNYGGLIKTYNYKEQTRYAVG